MLRVGLYHLHLKININMRWWESIVRLFKENV